jgi:chemotaxis protein CheY-P-specific phosphatase CheC
MKKMETGGNEMGEIIVVEREQEREDSMLELSPFLKDALNELGNIASCHAVTALAEMTGMTINIDVPTVDVVAIGDAEKLVEVERIVAGDLVTLDGGFSGYLQVLFPERSAFLIVDILLGRTSGETKGIETEMEVSALTETGNILASSFCSAIADLLQFTLAHETEHIILFKCNFQENENEIYGYILLFPHPDSLKGLLSTLEAKVGLK